jgi:hypothetical protein
MLRLSDQDPGMLGAVKGLFARRYRTVTALDAISFEIPDGELDRILTGVDRCGHAGRGFPVSGIVSAVLAVRGSSLHQYRQLSRLS